MPDSTDTTTPADIIQPHNVGVFHAFCEYPSGLTFQNQEAGEKIILFVRRHFVTNVPWIIITLLLILTPLVLIPFFEITNIVPFGISATLTTILLLFYYLLLVVYAFTNFLNWFYNIGIVTDRNILDIDYSELVNINISATRVTKIEDVTYMQSGFFKTFFDYGDVFIQTAATNPDFEFLRIPHPARAVDLVRQLIGKSI